jgi:hypothetical protein
MIMPKHLPYKRHIGKQYTTLHTETMYRTLAMGLCSDRPTLVGVGVEVTVLDPGPLYFDLMDRLIGPGDNVLCVAEIDGAPAYGWLLLSWLDPINPQRELFPTEQPTLFA